MAYRVFIDKAAEKDIDRLPKNTRKLVLEEIKELAKDPRKPRAEPLEGKLKLYWKTRVGDYRIAYEIRDDQVIVYVVRVLDRKEIYRILGRMQRPPPLNRDRQSSTRVGTTTRTCRTSSSASWGCPRRTGTSPTPSATCCS